jgi:hypothetical protein
LFEEHSSKYSTAAAIIVGAAGAARPTLAAPVLSEPEIAAARRRIEVTVSIAEDALATLPGPLLTEAAAITQQILETAGKTPAR